MSWVFAFVEALFLAWTLLQLNSMWFWDLSDYIAMIVLALIFVWPVYWIGAAIDGRATGRATLEQAHRDMFVAAMKAGHCKVTSFVGTKNMIYPVWTCSDGTAHIQEN